jgi:hypothetical protein
MLNKLQCPIQDIIVEMENIILLLLMFYNYPKGKFFEDWLKKVGYSSEHIVRKAGEEGTKTHEMIEHILMEKN